MGNTAYISSRKKLKITEVSQQLNEINNQRFGGFFIIDSINGGWHIHYHDNGWEYWINETNRKLYGGYPKPISWIIYCWNVFSNELAISWKGKLSDEGISGTWNPVQQGTFTSYLQDRFKFSSQEYKSKWIEWEKSLVPLELTELLK